MVNQPQFSPFGPVFAGQVWHPDRAFVPQRGPNQPSQPQGNWQRHPVQVRQYSGRQMIPGLAQRQGWQTGQGRRRQTSAPPRPQRPPHPQQAYGWGVSPQQQWTGPGQPLAPPGEGMRSQGQSQAQGQPLPRGLAANRNQTQSRPSQDQGQQQPRGPHTGKGPRRSDTRIQDEVRRRLSQQGQVNPSQINAAVNNGEVTLTGSVNSRQAKRSAENLAESVSGVTDVHNQLTVQQQQPMGLSL